MPESNINNALKSERKRRFLEELISERACGNVLVASKNIGVDRAVMYSYRTDPEFANAWDEVKVKCDERLADEAENMLRVLVLKGNPTAIIFTLKNLRYNRWKDRSVLDKEPDDKNIKDYDAYRKECQRLGLDPDTGFPVSIGSTKMEPAESMQE